MVRLLFTDFWDLPSDAELCIFPLLRVLGLLFCVEHRHAQLGNVLWHWFGMAAVDMCIYLGTDLQTKVRAPSAWPRSCAAPWV